MIPAQVGKFLIHARWERRRNVSAISHRMINPLPETLVDWLASFPHLQSLQRMSAMTETMAMRKQLAALSSSARLAASETCLADLPVRQRNK
jgi:hypothetical protein